MEILEEPHIYFGKKIQLSGIVFKVKRKISSRGRWASFNLNDLGGEVEIVIYSDTLTKYEAYLIERNLILIDVETSEASFIGARLSAGSSAG